jgi:hypothetical protein
MNWFSKINLSVTCPYCETGYTFSKPELKLAWKQSGSVRPLHAACKKAMKETTKAEDTAK